MSRNTHVLVHLIVLCPYLQQKRNSKISHAWSELGDVGLLSSEWKASILIYRPNR